MAGMLDQLIRKQKGEAQRASGAEPISESRVPDAIIGNTMVEYKFHKLDVSNQFPAYKAGATHASEPKIYESKSYLPVPFVQPETLQGESVSVESAEDVARESDEPMETARGSQRAEPIPAAPFKWESKEQKEAAYRKMYDVPPKAAPPSSTINLGAFLRAAKRAGVTVNVTVESKANNTPAKEEVDPLAGVFARPAIVSEKRQLSSPAEAESESENETTYVGRMAADYRNHYDSDLHVPYDRIASYRKWADQSMVLESLHRDEQLLLGTEAQRAEWKRLAEIENQTRKIEDDRTNGDIRDSSGAELTSESTTEVEALDGSQSRDEDVESYGDYAGGVEESSVAAVDILSAPSIVAGINFTLDPSQEAAIIRLASEPCGCLIGAAGTGKTTTTKMLVHTLMYGNMAWGVEPLRLKTVDIKKYHERGADKGKKKKGSDSEKGTIIPSIAMVAFTGQATQVLKKNMPKEWARNVMTIHLLLGYAPTTYEKADGTEGTRFEPSYTKYNKMPWDVIIVDETSMVSVDLWHQLLDASKPGCRFYFIGDLNQLPPPIGAGVLGFALSKWPVCELTVVHRQADDTANRIVDTAHRILRGEAPEFDDTAAGPGWRVAGMQLKHSSEDAAEQIIRVAYQLSKLDYKDGTGPVYDPWRDRIMVAMNGFNPDRPNYVLGQEPLNEELSRVFAGKDSERIIINAKKKIKKFSVGYRVMATKNEPPNVENRVTNGLTGKIIDIKPNEKWTGDWDMVGPEKQVRANRAARMAQLETHEAMSDGERANSLGEAISNFRLKATPGKSESGGADEDSEKQGGPCSHIVTVAFDNGGSREYRLNAQVEQLQIAYASTVHKAQGAEMPLAIVVIHHNQKMMLNREMLYTAVTRASQRVLLLYTDQGLRIALNTQKISGKTLAEKIRQYQELLGEGTGKNLFRTMNVRLFQDDVVAPEDDASDYDEGVDDLEDVD